VLQLEEPDGTLRLTLIGETDMTVAPALAEELQQLTEHRQRLRLDLSEVAFIDASGLDSITGALSHARRLGAELEIDRRVSRSVERILALTGTAPVLWPRPPARTNGRPRRPALRGALRRPQWIRRPRF
jgi:anti-anti-sigma factor